MCRYLSDKKNSTIVNANIGIAFMSSECYKSVREKIAYEPRNPPFLLSTNRNVNES